MSTAKSKVAWCKGYRNPGQLDPEVAHAEVEKIRKANGGEIEPEVVVAAAKRVRHPLHKVFSWDDKKAAHEHRLEQSRRMLRSFVVVYKESPKAPMRTYEVERVVAKEGEPPKNVYRTLEDILKDPVARNELLGRAIGDLLRCQGKYRQLQELGAVFSALDKILETVEVPAAM